jgi:hypothetical protein
MENDSGHRYIIVLVDCFSKFMWAKEAEKRDAETILAFLQPLVEAEKWKEIQCDNGGEFANGLLKSFLDEKGVKRGTNEINTFIFLKKR